MHWHFSSQNWDWLRSSADLQTKKNPEAVGEADHMLSERNKNHQAQIICSNENGCFYSNFQVSQRCYPLPHTSRAIFRILAFWILMSCMWMQGHARTSPASVRCYLHVFLPSKSKSYEHFSYSLSSENLCCLEIHVISLSEKNLLLAITS